MRSIDPAGRSNSRISGLTNIWTTMPIEVSGDWGTSSLSDVHSIVSSARASALQGLSLSGTLAPALLKVIGDPKRPCPQVWSRDEADRSATILLSSKDRYWAQLAYQFGHELGHVICNSWTSDGAKIFSPSHWLEEAIVEAFAVYCLRQMSTRWETQPPYPSFTSFATCLASYAEDRLDVCRNTACGTKFSLDAIGWFVHERPALEASLSLTEHCLPMVAWLAEEYQREPSLLDCLPALNRWPDRGGLSLPLYLAEWTTACNLLGVSDGLPQRIMRHLQPSTI